MEFYCLTLIRCASQPKSAHSLSGKAFCIGNGAAPFSVAVTGPRFDLFDTNPACDSNRWVGNVFVTGNPSCVH